jgi:hypothetical protein
MITAGDVEFQPDSTWQPKMFGLTTHVMALAADQLTPQSTICQNVTAEIGNASPPVAEVTCPRKLVHCL